MMSRARGNEGFMWECPNFAEFDGHEALIMSPQGVKPEGYRFMNLHQSVAMLGAMDYESGRFYRDEFQLLDKLASINTRAGIPAGLASLKTAEILHSAVVEKQDMPKAVAEFAAKK